MSLEQHTHCRICHYKMETGDLFLDHVMVDHPWLLLGAVERYRGIRSLRKFVYERFFE